MQRVLELIAACEQPKAPRHQLLEAFAKDKLFPLVTDDHATFFFWDGEPYDSVFLQHWVFGLPSRIELLRNGNPSKRL